MPTRRILICNYLFVALLLLLVLNDQVWKEAYGNAVTGKLSDLAGILLLPLLLAFLFPRWKQHAAWVSGLLFLLWKLPLSESLIRWYNSFSPIGTSRVVDGTDLFVLLLLPLAHRVVLRIDRWKGMHIRGVHPFFLLLPSCAALTATSPPPYYYFTQLGGNLRCFGCDITVPYSQDEIVRRLEAEGIRFDSIRPVDSAALARVPSIRDTDARWYHIKQLIMDGDTVRGVDLTMLDLRRERTRIYFNGAQVEENLDEGKVRAKLTRQYRRLIFRGLRQGLRQ